MKKRKYFSALLLVSMLVSAMPGKLWAGDGAAPFQGEEASGNLSRCEITVQDDKFIYDGTAKIPEVAVKNGEKTLREDKDYVLVYGNNTNAGVATVTVVGMGDFEGGVKKTFSIAPKSLDDLKINYFR